MLFGSRLQDIAKVRLEQYKLPVPKALVILWQALIHKNQGITSEGIFRVSGSKEDIAAGKKYITSGAWDRKVLGGALSGVFSQEWWKTQEHPRDAFCAGNLIKVCGTRHLLISVSLSHGFMLPSECILFSLVLYAAACSSCLE